MKISAPHFALKAAVASLLLVLPLSAQAHDDHAEPTPEQAQAYIDAQTCAVLLKKQAGTENVALADAALERAKALAPVNGDDSQEKFDTSLSNMALIVDMASAEEHAAFLATCQKG